LITKFTIRGIAMTDRDERTVLRSQLADLAKVKLTRLADLLGQRQRVCERSLSPFKAPRRGARGFYYEARRIAVNIAKLPELLRR
jgi:hypothetical protein